MGFLARIRRELRHAFSLAPPDGPLTEEDFALLDRVAAEVQRRRLELPAVLWLETLKPVGFLGAQALVALRPIAHAVLAAGSYDRFVKVLERRDGIDELLKRIERSGG